MLTADGVQIPDVKNVTIPADTTDAHILLFNSADNGYNLAFEIVLADSGETLYSSGLVEPGMCVEDIILSAGLVSGEYKAVLNVRIVEQESNTETGGASVEFVLLVKREGS